jgi:preprotein translocase subunit YajC
MESMLLPILMFAALGGLMYFSMKKQKRQAAQTKQMQEQLIPGTRVMTTSGLHGTVTAVADDTIELEVAPGMRTTWVRAAVREVVVPAPVEESYADSYADSYEDSYDDDSSPEIVEADPDTGSNNGINIRKSNDLN